MPIFFYNSLAQGPALGHHGIDFIKLFYTFFSIFQIDFIYRLRGVWLLERSTGLRVHHVIGRYSPRKVNLIIIYRMVSHIHRKQSIKGTW